MLLLALPLLGGRCAPGAPQPVLLVRSVIDPVDLPDGRNPRALGDIDGDGLLDVVAQRGKGTGWYQDPSWTFHEIHPTYGGGEQAQAVDLDGDGDTDVVVSGLSVPDEDPGWFENPLAQGGDPAVDPWPVHDIGTLANNGAHDLEVADLDGDGRLDLVMMLAVFFQRAGPGGLSWQQIPSQQILPGRGDKGTAIGDVDGDGDVDIVTASASAPWRVLWFENPRPAADPASTAWTAHEIGPGFYRPSLRVADLDGDGHADVLVVPAYEPGGLSWYRGPPDARAPGAVWTHREIDPSYGYVHSSGLHAVDMDGDGTLDVVLAEQEQSPLRRLAIFYNHGGAAAWTEQVVATTGGFAPKVGDVDGDGRPDVLNSNTGYWGASNPLELWRNSGLPDLFPPAITGASVLPGRTTATVFWNTDEPARARVYGYAASADEGSVAIEAEQVTRHEVVLRGLRCNTAYQQVAVARDAGGSESPGTALSVTTLPCGPESDLVGHWPFDEGSGATTADTSGNGHDGSLAGAAWSGDTPDGSDASLAFSGDRVDVGAIQVPGEAITIAFWLRADDLAGADEQSLVAKTTGSADADQVWTVDVARSRNRSLLRFRLRTDGAVTAVGSGFYAALANGVWTHVAAVYDGREMRLYEDGVDVGAVAATGALDPGAGIPVAIGNHPAGAGSVPFAGRIDDVRVYQRALDAGEIAQLAGASP